MGGRFCREFRPFLARRCSPSDRTAVPSQVVRWIAHHARVAYVNTYHVRKPWAATPPHGDAVSRWVLVLTNP